MKTEGLHFTFHLDPRAVRLFGAGYGTVRQLPAKDAVKAIWDLIEKRNDGGLHRIKGVCLSGITSITTTTNSMALLMGGPLFKRVTVGAIGLEPGFIYGPSAHEMQRGLFFDVSFYARGEFSTNAGPVHISLRWSDIDSHWVPNEMLTDVHLNIDSLF